MTEIYIDKLIDAIGKLAQAIICIDCDLRDPGTDLLNGIFKTMAELREFRKPRD